MKNIVRFFGEVRGELSKVVWSPFDEFVEATIVVLILVVFFALYMGAVDLGFFHLVQYVFKVYG